MGGVIGIRREDKSKWERRVPLVPKALQALHDQQGIQSFVQPAPLRIYQDEEFELCGSRIQEDLAGANVVFGVKEIPPALFTSSTTYMFFAHVIKGQAYNMPMLRRMMTLKCNLIDYEKVTDERGRRLIFFGWHAGVVAMIESLWALGQRLTTEGIANPFSEIRNTHTYNRLEEARADLRKAGEQIRSQGLPPGIAPLIVGVAGYGNVGLGVQEILNELPVIGIEPSEVIAVATSTTARTDAIYKVVFKEEHLVAPKSAGKSFDLQDYYHRPDEYVSCFQQYLPYLTILMNCNYWDARYPRLVSLDSVRNLWAGSRQPQLRILGDASCDVGGSIECTVHTTDPGDPVYVYDPKTGAATMGVSGDGPVVLAVDILPSELPREASEYFSSVLAPFVPSISRADFGVPTAKLDLPPPIRRALVLHRGELTQEFAYIRKYVDS